MVLAKRSTYCGFVYDRSEPRRGQVSMTGAEWLELIARQSAVVRRIAESDHGIFSGSRLVAEFYQRNTND